MIKLQFSVICPNVSIHLRQGKAHLSSDSVCHPGPEAERVCLCKARPLLLKGRKLLVASVAFFFLFLCLIHSTSSTWVIPSTTQSNAVFKVRRNRSQNSMKRSPERGKRSPHFCFSSELKETHAQVLIISLWKGKATLGRLQFTGTEEITSKKKK